MAWGSGATAATTQGATAVTIKGTPSLMPTDDGTVGA